MQVRAPGVPSDLQVGREGVGEPHVAWEGTEDEVAELDAVGRDHVAEAVVVVAQELGEVVQQDQKHSQCTLWRGGWAGPRGHRSPNGRKVKTPNLLKSNRAAAIQYVANQIFYGIFLRFIE